MAHTDHIDICSCLSSAGNGLPSRLWINCTDNGSSIRLSRSESSAHILHATLSKDVGSLGRQTKTEISDHTNHSEVVANFGKCCCSVFHGRFICYFSRSDSGAPHGPSTIGVLITASASICHASLTSRQTPNTLPPLVWRCIAELALLVSLVIHSDIC
jgi:hypothetical protein